MAFIQALCQFIGAIVLIVIGGLAVVALSLLLYAFAQESIRRAKEFTGRTR